MPLGTLVADALVGTVSPVPQYTLSPNIAAAAIGTVQVAERVIALTGVAATGLVGDNVAVYWKLIDDSQIANWQNISDAQSVAWTAISNAQTSSWAAVSTAQTPGWGAIDTDETAGWVVIPTE